jgi:hypothetical protein
MQLANQQLIIKDHTEWFPNTSFSNLGPSPDWIAEQGYYIITAWKPYNHTTEKLIPSAPHLHNGMCCIVDIAPLSKEELQERINTQWAAIRAQRNQLLKDSDWTQLPDAPVDQTAWAIYRQELRDITSQLDPSDIVWPKMGNI